MTGFRAPKVGFLCRGHSFCFSRHLPRACSDICQYSYCRPSAQGWFGQPLRFFLHGSCNTRPAQRITIVGAKRASRLRPRNSVCPFHVTVPPGSSGRPGGATPPCPTHHYRRSKAGIPAMVRKQLWRLPYVHIIRSSSTPCGGNTRPNPTCVSVGGQRSFRQHFNRPVFLGTLPQEHLSSPAPVRIGTKLTFQQPGAHSSSKPPELRPHFWGQRLRNSLVMRFAV